VSGQLHIRDSLPPGKELSVPIRQEAGWAPEPVWKQWGREKSLLLPRIEPLSSSP